MIEFVFYLLFHVDKDDVTVLVHHGLESVSLHIDNEGTAPQVVEFALQALVLSRKFGIFSL